ncbi:hypothetical protein EYF80_045505 [Liparis tanakae]|uniref:Uncharacterized protein n=1 Tax=Liparis tanakae TaxID=230148 RepID=A0A4Z2FSX2_9TELE|nr:hypothetical protein EYF80_045505 [Liparis tanakae]
MKEDKKRGWIPTAPERSTSSQDFEVIDPSEPRTGSLERIPSYARSERLLWDLGLRVSLPCGRSVRRLDSLHLAVVLHEAQDLLPLPDHVEIVSSSPVTPIGYRKKKKVYLRTGQVVQEAEGVEGVADDLSDGPRRDEEEHAVLTLHLDTQQRGEKEEEEEEEETEEEEEEEKEEEGQEEEEEEEEEREEEEEAGVVTLHAGCSDQTSGVQIKPMQQKVNNNNNNNNKLNNLQPVRRRARLRPAGGGRTGHVDREEQEAGLKRGKGGASPP